MGSYLIKEGNVTVVVVIFEVNSPEDVSNIEEKLAKIIYKVFRTKVESCYKIDPNWDIPHLYVLKSRKGKYFASVETGEDGVLRIIIAK